MVVKLWTLNQMKMENNYDFPISVSEEVRKTLEILDENYGKDRITGDEDGGCVLLLLCDDEEERLATYEQILTEYKISTDLVEFKDELYEDDKLRWYSELYILTEYTITIIYSVAKDNK